MTTTRRENASTSETRPELTRFAPGWNPARAWRLRTLYPPIARAVEELCRVAREGVVLSSPFNGHPVVAAERAVNDLYRAATGSDHPRLGRHLEYGLPDLDATREWVGAAFPHVETRSVDHVALWQ